MIVIGSHKRMLVYKKTDFRCAICGFRHQLDCSPFIPTWTRIPSTEVKQLIPLCTHCQQEVDINFIELGKLRYLPELYVEELMREYESYNKYLRKYTKSYGAYRTGKKLDVAKALITLDSYDQYLENNKSELNWESL